MSEDIVLVILLVVNSRLFFKFLLVVWFLNVCLILLFILLSGGGFDWRFGFVVDEDKGDFLKFRGEFWFFIFCVLGLCGVWGELVWGLMKNWVEWWRFLKV